MRKPIALVTLALAALGCDANPNNSGTDGGSTPLTPVEVIPLGSTIESASLSGPVDLVRDQWGIPHVYGGTLPDVAFAQGYAQAQDRLIQMDLLRRNADGTLSELVGELSDAVVNNDINMRIHHLRSTAQATFDQLKASSDPIDMEVVAALGRFADGVNAYAADLLAGNYQIPGQLAFLYAPQGFRQWNEVDSLLLINFETFYFNFSASADIAFTQLQAAAQAAFDQSSDPDHAARKGIYKDLVIFGPIDPTYIISGWTGMNGDSSRAALDLPDPDGNLMALLAADGKQLTGIGRDWRNSGTTASNNWIVGPKLTANGHVLVSNDTHVPLQNPSIWHMVHLVSSDPAGPVNAMGESIPGVPAIVLGMNPHVAWGATTDQIDQSDVYQETIVSCDNSTDPCVMFKGAKVPLTTRKESFGIGKYGKISKTVEVTFYEVPHHGPILPRVNADHTLQALGTSELSVRYVGYEPAMLVRAATTFLRAKTMQEWVAALDRDNATAAFNWVVGDDQGNFGWTEYARVPRRAPGYAPWLILPGDGSAEWGADMDPKYIPHAWNPDKGFIETSNNDPIGTTDDDDPFFDEPMVDGAPLYLSWDYADGARSGRATKRIQAMIDSGHKMTLDDMQSVQADTVSEYGQLLNPTLVDALQALSDENATPGKHPELAPILAAASSMSKTQLAAALAMAKAWSFDTPSAVAEENPTPAQVTDSQATLLFHTWIDLFAHRTLDDEAAAIAGNLGLDPVKLVMRASLHPDKLATGISMTTGDALLFDDLTTKSTVESKLMIAATAALDTLDALDQRVGPDPAAWRWGTVHTLTLDFLVPMAALKIPLANDPKYPNGFPRHGAPETVDPGGSVGAYTYNHGPGIRFVCELDPDKGPIARNVLPGGEDFDPGSPHYKDLMELWRKNQTFDLAYHDADVVKSAQTEYMTNATGRIRFQPKK
jgi:penicillin amidase